MQIVGYEAAVKGPPSLLFASDGDLQRRPLGPGDELGLSLGERRCAGSITDAGHRPCPATAVPYCEDHADRWPCARCRGRCHYPTETCREPHVVYLAAFAPSTFKVGVTRPWRLRERLREQGADRGVDIAEAGDGRQARRREARLAERDDLVDRVAVAQKIRGLHRSVAAAAWTALLAEFEAGDAAKFEYDHDLVTPAVPATLADGIVRGTQGRVLLLEHADTTYAVDMRDLVGHEVETGERTTALQASLGSYD